MRVVLYHPRALVGDGGITNSVRELAPAMAAHGAEVVVAHDHEPGRRGPEGPVEWAPIRHVGPSLGRVPVGLERTLAGSDAVVLHSAWTSHNAAAAAAARRTGIPYILAPRGAYDPAILRRHWPLKRGWWWAFERRLVRSAGAMHVFFQSQRPGLAEVDYHGPVIVAPNGVSIPPGLGWDGGSGGYILYIGRFDPEHKGLDILVRAVASLSPSQRPELRLHGPDWRGGKRRLIQLVNDLGVGDQVTVGEAVYGDTKWSLLRSAQGFVYPSRWEGFGNAPAEAAAVGVPTLTTTYPLGEYLAERGAALVVDPTPEALAEGLGALVRPEAADVGGRGAQAAQAFTWPAVAGSWITQMAALEAVR